MHARFGASIRQWCIWGCSVKSHSDRHACTLWCRHAGVVHIAHNCTCIPLTSPKDLLKSCLTSFTPCSGKLLCEGVWIIVCMMTMTKICTKYAELACYMQWWAAVGRRMDCCVCQDNAWAHTNEDSAAGDWRPRGREGDTPYDSGGAPQLAPHWPWPCQNHHKVILPTSIHDLSEITW